MILLYLGMSTVRLLGRVFDLRGMHHRFERPIADAYSSVGGAFIGRGVSRASGAMRRSLTCLVA